MKRILATLKICKLVFMARTFGKYRHSIGSPNNEDYAVYRYKGLTVCIPDTLHQEEATRLDSREYFKLYQGEIEMHPYEGLAPDELKKIENDPFAAPEHRTLARRTRQRLEDLTR